MDSTLIAPAVVVILMVAYFLGRYYQSFVAEESEEYEHDGNQSTRIRHEANL